QAHGAPGVAVSLQFQTPDCTSQAFGGAGDGPVALGAVLGSSLFYVRPGIAQTITVYSIQYVASDGSAGLCQQLVDTGNNSRGPYQVSGQGPWSVVPLPTFTPPIAVTHP